MERDDFQRLRDTYLSPARPITSIEHLKGRESSLAQLLDALNSPGRHAFIYGYRGVGKSSLAQTAAYQLQRSDAKPIITFCDRESTFASVIRDIVLQFRDRAQKPTGGWTIGGGISVAGTGAHLSITRGNTEQSFNIENVSDAVRAIRNISPAQGTIPLVIDEFDQIKSEIEHAKFANFIKQLSDLDLNLKVIICGIAETASTLFSEHASIFRQIHTTEVERLKLQARLEIIEDALDALRFKMDDSFQYRIAQISDGFPSFVHLLGEKILTATFNEKLSSTNVVSYETGIRLALESVELPLKKRYEDAVHRNTRKLEPIVWALAADKLLDANVDTIWGHYVEITEQQKLAPEPRNRVSSKLSLLCRDAYGPILVRKRHANYTFSEMMMRAYARLRAERAGCQIGAENPGYRRAPEVKEAMIKHHDPS